jgi:hypothetical protein
MLSETKIYSVEAMQALFQGPVLPSFRYLDICNHKKRHFSTT